MNFKSKIPLILTLLFISTAHASWFSGNSSPNPLIDAHKAFLDGNFKDVAANIKRLYESESGEVAIQNGMELLEKTYLEVGKNGIPVNWTLPNEIKKLNIDIGRRQLPDQVDYSFKVLGRSSTTHKIIKNLTITDFSGNVILDKKSGAGDWWTSSKQGEEEEFELASYDMKKPQKEGLYFINARFSNGTEWRAWFILSGQLSSDSPAMSSPSVGETFRTQNPTLEWEDFRSPEYKTYERRTLWLGVSELGPYKQVFSLWRGYPNVETAVINKNLKDGKYRIILNYTEKRNFGGIVLGRASTTIRPFFVDATY